MINAAVTNKRDNVLQRLASILAAKQILNNNYKIKINFDELLQLRFSYTIAINCRSRHHTITSVKSKNNIKLQNNLCRFTNVKSNFCHNR